VEAGIDAERSPFSDRFAAPSAAVGRSPLAGSHPLPCYSGTGLLLFQMSCMAFHDPLV
jgi:hypothetical protein